MDSGLAVPTFQQGEDLIDCINKAMAFLSAMASRFSFSNNQLRMSSNPRNQETIQDGRVTVQQVQGRQTQSFSGTGNRGIATNSRGNYVADLDAYDSDCDDTSSAKAVLMENLSSCDSDVLSEVPYYDTYLNDMINQDVQEIPYYEQTHIVDFPDNEITNDSNITPYSQYLQESQDAGLKDTFNAFDKTLLDEITDVQTVFNQMKADVDQCSVDKNAFEIQNKQLTLKNELRKLKGKNVVDIVVLKPIATIAPGMFKLDIEPISHRLKNNRDAHEVYLEKTIENTDTLRGLVECARKQNPSEPLLEYACMFTNHVQELLVYVSKTCPSLTKPCEKLVVITPMNKDKKVRFVEPVTSSSNIPKQTDSIRTKDSNKPLLTST
ncbi:hypothetical protein Tco_0704004 [Tanacetum coccineum]|uniref:Reverse transcriptase domain-containing protein n=1 Tax=Tanacetum coccineum TaxID=301880 RepID=A0ABQ4Y2E4_9ASTR